MRIRGMLFAIGLVIASWGVASSAFSLADVPDDGSSVVMKVCTRCHSPARICRHLGNDSVFWGKTVDMMIANGATISAKDREIIEHWLTAAIPGDKPVCQ
ncbi:hypothetical protein [Desulfovibrio inopinatus]|uniref:hypothetical protein n=1 Tax=Desulfovibrio inopinatus TaxID=102109 RepID=UPI00041BEEAD|nr:hypothetical protein [Desulfovibrio inopinatus]